MKERERLIELLRNFSNTKRYFSDTKGIDHLRADYLLANGIIVPPCKVGDYIEWDNGISKHLHKIRAFYYEPDFGLRFELTAFSPVVSHESIKRIVSKEEAEKALEEMRK